MKALAFITVFLLLIPANTLYCQNDEFQDCYNWEKSNVILGNERAGGKIYIYINTDPHKVDVYNSSGNYLGTTPFQIQARTFRQSEPVISNLVFKKDGYKIVERSFTFRMNGNNKVFIKMNPISSSNTNMITRNVKITSDPTGASVYANQDYVGETPLTTRISWTSPNHRIEIRIEKSGYQTNRRMLTPTDTRVHVVLQY